MIHNKNLVFLYHGTYDPNGMQNIKRILHDDIQSTIPARRNTDFGPATYLTNRVTQAMEWATRRKTDGWLCSFTLDLSGLNVLNLDPRHEPPLRWIAELIYNRDFKDISQNEWNYVVRNWRINPDGYDIILGYTADDKYISMFRDFFTNNLSFIGLCKAAMLGDLGYQYAVRTHNGYNALQRCADNKQVLKSIWYPRLLMRQEITEKHYEYIKAQHGKNAENELFFSQMMRMNVMPDDPVVTFPRNDLEKNAMIEHRIFEETDALADYGIYPGAR